MGTLPQYTAGEPWEEDAVRNLVKQVQDAGLKMEVIESVNVHESIKIGLPERDHYIETYIQTIRLLHVMEFGLLYITLCRCLIGCVQI